MSSTKTAPLSPKVPGAVGGGAVGAFLLWLIGVLAFGAASDSAHATDAIAAVPWPIIGIVGPGLVALGGYLPRDLASTLFEGQASEDPTVYGNAMGAGTVTTAPPAAPTDETFADDPDDGTTSEPDDDEQARDARGRYAADA